MVCQVVSNTILIGADLKRNFLILPSNAVVINVQTWRVYRTETAWGGGHYEGHILYKKELPALKMNHLEKSLLGGMPKIRDTNSMSYHSFTLVTCQVATILNLKGSTFVPIM